MNMSDCKHRNKIIMIVGESGSGKTTAAEYFMTRGIPMICSYTDRARRGDTDNDHTFLTVDEFDKLKWDQMLGYTNYGGHRYCCLHSDVSSICTYVISEDSMRYIKDTYSDRYDLVTVRMRRDEAKRRLSVGDERVDRDGGRFTLPDAQYDHVVDAEQLGDLLQKLKIVSGKILSS